MLVSIVIPVYNMENHIEKCVNSLLNQTFENIEIICVNDCSQDNSLNILRDMESLHPLKIKIIDSKVNLKQGGARNLGVYAALGDYIYFVDSDDWAEPTLIENLTSKLSGKAFEIVYCSYRTRHKDSNEDKVINRANIDWIHDDLDKIKKKLIIAPSPIWSGLYSVDFFKELKIKFPENIFYEDNYIVPLLVCNAGSISKVQKPLMNYNMSNSSVTRTFNNERFFDRLKTSCLLFDEVSKYDIYDKYREELNFFIFEIYLLNTTIGCYRKFYPVKNKKAENIINDFITILPDFESNRYFLEKKNSNFLYRSYCYLLFNHQWVIKVLYTIKNKLLLTLN